MQSTLITLLASLLLIVSSCRKHDCHPENSWRIDGVAHDVHSAYYIIPSSSVQMLFVRDGDSTTRNSNVDFDFNTLPTTSGDYDINYSAGPTQMQILATSYFGNDQYGIYTSASTQHAIAHVTVADGKMTIDVPEVWLMNTKGSDSVKFSAHVFR